MERVTTVFLSSVQGNLVQYRDAIAKAIDKLDGFRCIKMEDFGARDQPSLDNCIQMVKRCDCLVALIGPLYGSSPEGDDRSYSEIEYDTAIESGITRLVFICPEDFPVPANAIESKTKQRKQQAFKARVEKERQRASFASAEQAVESVLLALFNWQLKRPSPPEEKSNQADQFKEPVRNDDGNQERVEGLSNDSIRQISETVDILATALKSGALDFGEHDTDSVDSLTAARLHLSAKTLFGRRCADELLSTHEMNVLYRFRQHISPVGWETKLLWRSLINDSFGVVPGWYWFKSDDPTAIGFFLWYIARRDTESSVKAHSIELLSILHQRPNPKYFQGSDILGEISTSSSPEVQKAFLEYLAENGTEEDLTYVDTISDLAHSDLNHAVEKARWSIKVKHNANGALLEITKMDAPPYSALAALEAVAGQLQVDLLENAIAHSNIGLRRLVTHILIDRKTLSKDTAFALLKQDLVPIRASAYLYLISLGERFNPAEIRESLKEPEDATNRLLTLSLLLGGVDVDSIIYDLYQSYTYEDLLQELDWYNVHGPIAYRVIAEHHFDKESDRIRHDLQEGFESLRKTKLDKILGNINETLRKELKDLPVALQEAAIKKAAEEMLEDKYVKLDDFVKSNYTTAALSGLALHCEQRDLLIGRHYLQETTTQNYGDAQARAAEIVGKFGDKSDVPLLLSVIEKLQGDKKESLLRIAVKLSPEIARELMCVDDTSTAKFAASFLVEAKDPEIGNMLEGLLNDENKPKREMALSFLFKIYNSDRLLQLLDSYLSRRSYFYNVVCWLDRLLFAPEPLNQIYRDQLTKGN